VFLFQNFQFNFLYLYASIMLVLSLRLSDVTGGLSPPPFSFEILLKRSR